MELVYEDLAPGIIVFKNVFPEEIHLTLIPEIEEAAESGLAPWHEASVRDNGANKVNKAVRDNKSTSFPYSYSAVNAGSPRENLFEKMSSLFCEGLDPIEKKYMSMFGISFYDHDSYTVLKYGIDQKFINHIDDHTNYPRRISMVYYINDDYEGGEIVFPRFNVSYKPKANEVIFFPSSYTYNHSVLPVKSGLRYAVVSWIH